MKFSFDLDGTITAYPEIFVELGKALRAAGHEVFILTGVDLATFEGRRKKKYPVLSQEGWYDRVLTSDLYDDNEKRLAREVMGGHLDNHTLVGIFKRRIAEDMEIDAHFDDDVSHVRATDAVPVFGVE